MTLYIKFTARIPKWFHEACKLKAENEARSLNQIINLLLSRWMAEEVEARRPMTEPQIQANTRLSQRPSTRNQIEKGATDDDDSN